MKLVHIYLQMQQPQQCVPDVIIWMLAGNKRVAYSRVPAHTLYYANDERGRGELCGKIQTLFLTVRTLYC